MSTKAERFKVINDTLNDGLSKEEFLKAFKSITAIVLKTQKKLADDNSKMRSDFQVFIQRISSDKVSDIEEIRTEARVVIGNAISTLTDSVNKKLASMQSKVDSVYNGREASEEALMTRLQAVIPTIEEIAKLFPVFGPDVRNALELLKGDERLDYTAIRGLEEAITRIQKSFPPQISQQKPGGRTGLYFYIDGVKKGIISNVNFVSGTNISIAYSKVNGQDTFTFNASGGGGTGGAGGVIVYTPVEQVDPILGRRVFTVTAQPQSVVADGTTYYEGAGYSYAALQITLDQAPSASVRALIPSTTDSIVITPTGAVNGINQTFAVPSPPKQIDADGRILYEGFGYTYSYLQVVLDIAPSQFIRAIIPSSSTTSIQIPPEVPDGISVKIFTTTGIPRWVIADGTTYYEGAGYSYAANKVTFDIAPSEYVRIII